jgi:hypothetical protein
MLVYTADNRREQRPITSFLPEKVLLPLEYYEEITDLDVTNPAERLEAIGHIIMRFFSENWKPNKDDNSIRPGYDYQNHEIVNAYGILYHEKYLTKHYLDDLRIMKQDVDLAIEALEAIEKYNQFPETPD